MDVDRTAPTPATPHHLMHDTASQPEHGDSNGVGQDARTHTSSPDRPLLHATSEGHQTLSLSQDNPYADFERVPAPPPPARGREGHVRVASRRRASASGLPAAPLNGSGIDWIVPVDEKGGVSAEFILLIRHIVPIRFACTTDAAHHRRTPSAHD